MKELFISFSPHSYWPLGLPGIPSISKTTEGSSDDPMYTLLVILFHLDVGFYGQY
jgi:hypothetical protein